MGLSPIFQDTILFMTPVGDALKEKILIFVIHSVYAGVPALVAYSADCRNPSCYMRLLFCPDYQVKNYNKFVTFMFLSLCSHDEFLVLYLC
jgi:hypothetical protein